MVSIKEQTKVYLIDHVLLAETFFKVYTLDFS